MTVVVVGEVDGFAFFGSGTRACRTVGFDTLPKVPPYQASLLQHTADDWVHSRTRYMQIRKYGYLQTSTQLAVSRRLALGWFSDVSTGE